MRIYKAIDRTGRAPYVITTSTHYVIIHDAAITVARDIPPTILINSYKVVYDAINNSAFASAIISIFDKIWGE